MHAKRYGRTAMGQLRQEKKTTLKYSRSVTSISDEGRGDGLGRPTQIPPKGQTTRLVDTGTSTKGQAHTPEEQAAHKQKK